jgi:hypothetical protein
MVTEDKLDCNKTLTIAEIITSLDETDNVPRSRFIKSLPRSLTSTGIDVEKDSQIMAIAVKCVWSS